jgi:hypothetical protein
MFVNEFGETFQAEVIRRKLKEDCDILDDILKSRKFLQLTKEESDSLAHEVALTSSRTQ